ncbi:hypothetical protein BC938DRAFT_479378 [Jimgerdemannia flammicorona]|uniref:Uncharacterized protein n=1 Tax=Jimgerdemannia flammicorona TaxID=994334 RepID=A0A433QXV3_9FUNG|nr:hypothetical protein BC938DRAFT_479378 [Jimgerdemannia flammicorona]
MHHGIVVEGGQCFICGLLLENVEPANAPVLGETRSARCLTSAAESLSRLSDVCDEQESTEPATEPFSGQTLSGQGRPLQARPLQARPLQARPLQVRPLQSLHARPLHDRFFPFRASSFFILPELSKLAVSHATPVPSIEHAPFLLNKAVKSVPPSKDNAILYAILMAPFLKQELQLSHLNGLSAEALEVLLMDAKDPRTTEFHLLACVVSWALFNDEFAISDSRYMVLLDYIYETEDDRLPNCIFDVSEQARDSILRMLPYIKLDLICPHRFRILTKLIDGLVDPSPISAAVFDYACKHIVCPRGHPSKRRGEEDVKVGDTVVGNIINGMFDLSDDIMTIGRI